MPAPRSAEAGPLTVLVTRPAAQAGPWVEALRVHGCRAEVLPLLGIEALDDPGPLQAAWRQLADHALVMFVSANAVEHFFAARPPGMGWTAGPWAASTGPGTSAALRAAGVPAAQIAEPDAAAGRFDSEALWAGLSGRDWTGRSVLVVRGEAGRDWLAERFAAAGAQVAFVAAYRRVAPAWDLAAQAVLAGALAQPAQHRWLISSSEALGHLATAAPARAGRTVDWSAQTAWATHPRIGEACQRLGFGRVRVVAPDPAAVASLAASEAAG